jgi:hypothetical protein
VGGEPTLDWASFLAKKNAELERLNGVYMNLLNGSGVDVSTLPARRLHRFLSLLLLLLGRIQVAQALPVVLYTGGSTQAQPAGGDLRNLLLMVHPHGGSRSVAPHRPPRTRNRTHPFPCAVH